MSLLRHLLITFLNTKKVNCREGNINDLNKGPRDHLRAGRAALQPRSADTQESKRGRRRVHFSEPGPVPAAELQNCEKFSSPSDVRRPSSGLCVYFSVTLFFPSTNLADPRVSLTSTSSSTPTSRRPRPKMSCRKRCKREIFKFAQYLFRLVTGTLNIGKNPTWVFGGRSAGFLLTVILGCWV